MLSWIRKIIDLLVVGLVPRLMETSGYQVEGAGLVWEEEESAVYRLKVIYSVVDKRWEKLQLSWLKVIALVPGGKTLSRNGRILQARWL